ncbi:BRCA1-A complex subunit Abraxas 1 isoform X2 [Neoarius graeffei]|uniref:BRCA1-A complex subunit Abraxas 1 isoform X2 n=1 Tax=Neoarius graeffei TaxID=443677 RepID=UPI00298D325B|nr:BRCA1-A complex subunit Abraxas 1 isoform X2 [Neoarius graeffei]
MEEYSTTVRTSGFVLSSLMFQHLNSDCDVEGLLLGESVGEEKNKITDSQTDHIQFVHTINIQKHITCRRTHSFYNNSCEVDKEKIKQVLCTLKEENVIGWYRQRRNTNQQMTLKEQLVHQNLRKLLPYQELVFLLLTPSEVTLSHSTHRLEYTAFIWNGSQYSSIPVSVSNLGTLEQQDYWRVSATYPSLSHSQAIKQHRAKFFSSEHDLREVENVNAMNDALLDEMKSACVKVEKSERRVEKLQAEIAELRDTVREQRKRQQDSDAKESSPPEKPEDNVLLCAALKALFPNTPPLRSRTLSLEGFPVLHMSCAEDHGVDVPTRLPLLLLQCGHTARKRKMSSDSTLKGKFQSTGISRKGKKRKVDKEPSDLPSESESDTEVEQ